MAIIKPFSCIRPKEGVAHQVAALPYDVYNRKEATEEVKNNPHSFLKIDRAETQMPDTVDTYDPSVYQKAKEIYEAWKKEGIFVKDPDTCYYLYELTMEGRSQTGVVGCASLDDYLNGVIKKHENTREEKEQDRIHHVDGMDAQTGPIFLAYRDREEIRQAVEQVKEEKPLYDFVSPDGVGHRVWKCKGPVNQEIEEAFQKEDRIYIADGHHRAASAVKVGLMRREKHPGYSGEEEFNRFLAVLFPESELHILPYNRVVRDLNGFSPEEFLARIQGKFQVTSLGEKAYLPKEKGCFGMFLQNQWYQLKFMEAGKETDAVASLDVSILQDHLLSPLLNIQDPRTDQRIEFIGGIRGTEELERRVREDMAVAFSLYPTSMGELFRVADAGRLMPPKSTWFEPKLRSGLFIHEI